MAKYYRTHNAIKWFTRNVTTDFQERIGNPIKNIQFIFQFPNSIIFKDTEKRFKKKIKTAFLKNIFSLGGGKI